MEYKKQRGDDEAKNPHDLNSISDFSSSMQQQIFDLLLNQEEVTWKTLLFDLIKNEQMDPWDVNISLLTQRYIQAIKAMQEHDFRISGKILLAAALLLKLKSAHLVDNDLTRFDALLNQTEDALLEEEFFDELAGKKVRGKESYQLIPRNPQPRQRKVSINDLVEALQRAMASRRRFIEQHRPVPFVVPKKSMDVLEAIRDIYQKLNYYIQKEKTERLAFSRLVPPRAGRREKVITFLPLLHLENQQKVLMEQEQHFAEIYVKLTKKGSGSSSSAA